MDAIEQYGFPKKCRSDRGSENINIANVQTVLGGKEAHIFGPSTANQRIESFWGRLRQLCLDEWIEFFLEMERNGLYDYENPEQLYIAIFVFGPLIESDLEAFIDYWDNQKIRKNKDSICPAGIPNLIFQYPNQYGADDCSTKLEDIDGIRRAVVQENGIIDSTECWATNMVLNQAFFECLQASSMWPITKTNILRCFMTLKNMVVELSH